MHEVLKPLQRARVSTPRAYSVVSPPRTDADAVVHARASVNGGEASQFQFRLAAAGHVMPCASAQHRISFQRASRIHGGPSPRAQAAN